MSKMKRILSAMLIPALLPTVLLTSCGKESDSMPKKDPTPRFVPQTEGIPASDDFTESVTNFAEALFRLSLEKGKNLVLSPLSVTYALTMTANGAEGETLAEFNSLNGGIDVNNMNEYLNFQQNLNLYRLTQSTSKQMFLKLLLKVWVIWAV